MRKAECIFHPLHPECVLRPSGCRYSVDIGRLVEPAIDLGAASSQRLSLYVSKRVTRRHVEWFLVSGVYAHYSLIVFMCFMFYALIVLFSFVSACYDRMNCPLEEYKDLSALPHNVETSLYL